MSALNRLHAKLGDFWWHSQMLFLAMREADFLNVSVGFWLVPKYVGQSELGAVESVGIAGTRRRPKTPVRPKIFIHEDT